MPCALVPLLTESRYAMHLLDTPAPVRLALTRDPAEDGAVCWINVQDTRLVGRVAKLQLVATLTVMESGERRESVLRELPLPSLRLGRQRVVLPATQSVFVYQGAKFGIRPMLRLIDSGGRVLVQRMLVGGRACLVGGRPKLLGCARSILAPEDHWCAFASFRALSSAARGRILAIVLLIVLLGGANLMVGIHDQFAVDPPPRQRIGSLPVAEAASVPRREALFYRPHRRGLPITDAAILSFVIVFLGWVQIRSQLRRYAHVEINLMLPPLRPDLRLPAADVVRGRVDTPLRQARIRVVAANLECSERKSDRGPVSVRDPVRAVVLYTRELRLVPAGSSIDGLLDGDIEFRRLFEQLYPPLMFDARWGLDLAWQVQLIHPELIDLAVEGPVHTLRFVDFMQGEGVRVVEPKA